MQERFGQPFIRFSHPSGLQLEVIEDDADRRKGSGPHLVNARGSPRLEHAAVNSAKFAGSIPSAARHVFSPGGANRRTVAKSIILGANLDDDNHVSGNNGDVACRPQRRTSSCDDRHGSGIVRPCAVKGLVAAWMTWRLSIPLRCLPLQWT